jgi:hypothetical protein
MPTLDLELPHRCTLDGARECCEKTFADLKVQYANYIGDATVAWHGEGADFTLLVVAPARIEITGTITVAAKSVTLKGEFALPLMLRAFPVAAMVSDSIRKSWAAKCAKCPRPQGGDEKA